MINLPKVTQLVESRVAYYWIVKKGCDNDDNKKPPGPVSQEDLGCRMRTSHHQIDRGE